MATVDLQSPTRKSTEWQDGDSEIGRPSVTMTRLWIMKFHLFTSQDLYDQTIGQFIAYYECRSAFEFEVGEDESHFLLFVKWTLLFGALFSSGMPTICAWFWAEKKNGWRCIWIDFKLWEKNARKTNIWERREENFAWILRMCPNGVNLANWVSDLGKNYRMLSFVDVPQTIEKNKRRSGNSTNPTTDWTCQIFCLNFADL